MLNRERVQVSYLGLVLLVRKFEIVSEQETADLGWTVRAQSSQYSVNSLVPSDLMTIVPEPRQIEGNQQDLAKRGYSDLPSLCSSSSPFAAIH